MGVRMRLAAMTTLLLCGCASPQQTEAFRRQCLSYGYQPGTPELASCVENRVNRQSQVATGVGTNVLTQVIASGL